MRVQTPSQYIGTYVSVRISRFLQISRMLSPAFRILLSAFPHITDTRMRQPNR